MGKIVCHQKGKLIGCCNECKSSWKRYVEVNQELNDACPICGNTKVGTIDITIQDERLANSKFIDIPDFLKQPTEVVTISVMDLKEMSKLHYKLGTEKGKQIGFDIGLVVAGIITFILFCLIGLLH